MKLIDLELLVVALRANAGVDANPNITFYKRRTKVDGEVMPLESAMFVEFDIDSDVPLATLAWECKLIASSAQCVGVKGDFNLPLNRIPFYKTLQ